MMSHETDFSACIFLRDLRLLSFFVLARFDVRSMFAGYIGIVFYSLTYDFDRYFVSSFYRLSFSFLDLSTATDENRCKLLGTIGWLCA